MSKIHFDCSSGVSSDMVLGALIHLGAYADDVASELRGLGLAEFRLRVNTACRQGVSGYAAGIEIIGTPHTHGHHAHTSYRDIAALIRDADIGQGAKKYAGEAYRALAVAEAAAHGTAIEYVHFHEVGSPRTVYAVVGAAIAAGILAREYGATGFTCGTLTDGSGTIECSHGTIPVPVPAVRELLKQTDIRLASDTNIKTELVTPSGLALLIGLGTRHAPAPVAQRTGAMEGSRPRTGYGFGTRDIGLLGAVRATLHTSN